MAIDKVIIKTSYVAHKGKSIERPTDEEYIDKLLTGVKKNIMEDIKRY